MRSSWKLGSLSGIGVYIHWTFLLLLGWVLVGHLMSGQGLSVALVGVVFVVLLFGCVVLHEFGHALMARRFGVRTRDITLLPIGGVARLERIPEAPRQELLIALAGPAVNVIIAAAIAGFLAFFGGLVAVTTVPMVGGSLLAKLMWVNLSLAIFNLLPAFPMDGGRVLRALLAIRRPRARATEIANRVGNVMAVMFAITGLLTGNLLLLLIAGFVFLAGEAESHQVQLKEATRAVPVSAAMSTNVHSLHLHDSIESAARVLLRGYRGDFPVLAGDEVVGMLRSEDVTHAVLQHETDLFASDLMKPHCPVIEAGSPLSQAVERMQQGGGISIAVVEKGQLVGILSLEQIGQWLTLHSALEKPALVKTIRGKPSGDMNRPTKALTRVSS